MNYLKCLPPKIILGEVHKSGLLSKIVNCTHCTTLQMAKSQGPLCAAMDEYYWGPPRDHAKPLRVYFCESRLQNKFWSLELYFQR